jgi:hypothetical protein
MAYSRLMAAAISSVSILAAVSISSETGIVTVCIIFFSQDKRIIQTKPRPLAFKKPYILYYNTKTRDSGRAGYSQKLVMPLAFFDFYEKNIQ